MEISTSISPKDLADQIYWEDEEDVLTLIKRIDRRWGECDFTVKLLQHFAQALRDEGFTVNLEIKEP